MTDYDIKYFFQLDEKQQIPQNNCENYLTFDGTKLRIDTEVSKCETYFETLNEIYEIYDSVEEMFIQSDLTNELPKEIFNFKNLKSLTLEGCRWWNLSMCQIPNSVTNLQMRVYSPSCFEGMEDLINLKVLKLLLIYGLDDEEDTSLSPLSNNPSLQHIELYVGETWAIPKWQKVGQEHPFFKLIKDRIVSITYDDTVIKIDLK